MDNLEVLSKKLQEKKISDQYILFSFENLLRHVVHNCNRINLLIELSSEKRRKIINCLNEIQTSLENFTENLKATKNLETIHEKKVERTRHVAGNNSKFHFLWKFRQNRT